MRRRAPSLPALVLALLVSSGCQLESSQSLELSLQLGTCDDADLSAISVLSVEVYGSNRDGSECALARRCIQLSSPDSLDDVRLALEEINQPIIDIPLDEEDLLIVVTGHATNDCFAFEDRAVCGFADLRDSEDGALTVPLNCSACPTRSYPLCQ